VFEIDPRRRDELVDSWAARIVGRGMGTIAVFLLEAHKPVAGLGAHAALAFRPVLSAVTSLDVVEAAAFFHDVDNVERLLTRIEELERKRLDRRTAMRRRAKRIHRLRVARRSARR
jgi:hypothetical protein